MSSTVSLPNDSEFETRGVRQETRRHDLGLRGWGSSPPRGVSFLLKREQGCGWPTPSSLGWKCPLIGPITNCTGDQCGAAVLITKPFARVLVPDVPVRLSGPVPVVAKAPLLQRGRQSGGPQHYPFTYRRGSSAIPGCRCASTTPGRDLRAGGAVAGEQLDARRRRRRGTACVILRLSRLRSGRNGSRRQRAYRECRRGKCPDNFSHRNLIPRSVWNYGTYYRSPVWSTRGIRNCQKIRGQLTRRSAHRNRSSARRPQPGVHGAPGPPLSNRRQHHSGDPVSRQAPNPLSVTPRRRENGGRVACRRRRVLGYVSS